MFTRLLVSTLVVLGLSPATWAVEFRVATFNIGADFADGNSEFSLGAPGTPDHDSVRDILRRMDADVVALQEIHFADTSGTPDHLHALAASAGYPYRYAPQFTSLDFTFRVVFLSRHPIVEAHQIGSPLGANEIARRFPAIKVDVPGTERDPVVISAHLKAGTSITDRFRKAVEMRRLAERLEDMGLDESTNFIILGDFNLSSTNLTFAATPTSLPGSYALGDDIDFPVTYSTNPLTYFSQPRVIRLDPRHLNGSPSTYNTTHTNGGILDLILVSPAIATRPLATEIYNSNLDTTNAVGLRKAGDPLTAGTSSIASDHYAIFVDVELDHDDPELSLTSSTEALEEDGAVSHLTVALPSFQESIVSIKLSASDPNMIITPSRVDIPAGITSAVVEIAMPRNFRIDGRRSIEIHATAAGFSTTKIVIEVSDVDGVYRFTAPNQTIEEDFTGFKGMHAPAPWVTSGSTWGESTGFRSLTNGAIAHFGNRETAVVGTTFFNDSTQPIHALKIAYAPIQWYQPENGTADSISASLVHQGIHHPLPQLTYLSGELHEWLEHTLEGLVIAPGDSFDLWFYFIPGEGGGAPANEVFINEFHYNNLGADVNEFVEIAVGPAFTGNLSSTNLLLYNGATGAAYATHRLDSFRPGAVTASGHRLFYKSIPGIQNGDPDGFALVREGVAVQLISYGGEFTATAGPAAGMRSHDVETIQSGADPVDTGSIGLRGRGGTGDDFTWEKLAGQPHTPGEPNSRQEFITPLLPQGLAINAICITAISPDPLDADGDGQSDADELVFGTDPHNRSSFFQTSLRAIDGEIFYSFVTHPRRIYHLERSADLRAWTELEELEGDGSIATISVSTSEPVGFLRLRVSLTIPP